MIFGIKYNINKNKWINILVSNMILIGNNSSIIYGKYIIIFGGQTNDLKLLNGLYLYNIN